MILDNDMLEGKTILITGGSGFVGYNLNRHLGMNNSVYSVQIDEITPPVAVEGVTYIREDITKYDGK